MMATIAELDQLVEVYRNARDGEVALFLGSGVNGGSWAREHPACASWPALLQALDRYFHPQPRLDDAALKSETDWIRAAGMILADKDRQAVVAAIDEAIYSGMFPNPKTRARTPRKHKILTWTVLQSMETLRATVCFSAAINDSARARSMRRNPKVGRVLTTNYDFFFSAAWPRYTSMRRSWWPATWASTGTRPVGAGPIIYLHGYLPYSGAGEKEAVIDADDYQRAYSEGVEGRHGFAWRQLTDAVDRCHLLFIGFSFSDRRVGKALRRSSNTRENFALLRQSDSRALKAARETGVKPVLLDSWSQLPEALGSVYRAGLGREELDRTGLTGAQYWAKLQRGLEPRKKA